MKKALAMALGAMLVAGAMPASAKSQIDFSGHYRTYLYGNFNPQFADKEIATSDVAFYNRLNLDLAFHATDEISVYWRLRAPSADRWGLSGNTTVWTRWIYGEIKQDWGTLSIGRLKDEYTDLGLASLGWAPSGPDVNATYVGPFDFDNATDGFRYANRWDNGFQLAIAGLRLGSMQKFDNSTPEVLDAEGDLAGYKGYRNMDETNDLFVVEPAFFWDGGGASFGIHYQRDHTLGYVAGEDALTLYGINPALNLGFGDFSYHLEGKMAWGKYGQQNEKSSGYAVYMDFDYNYGPGNVNLAAWYATGPDNDANSDETTGVVDLGPAFAPLIVAYGSNGNGWARGQGNAVKMANIAAAGDIMEDAGAQGMANHWAANLNGAHAFTDDLTFTYAIAYLNLNKVDPGAKKEIGWEADLGLQIQLLDNLHFGTTLGYLMAGDAFKGTDENAKVDDAYAWLNTLTFNF